MTPQQSEDIDHAPSLSPSRRGFLGLAVTGGALTLAPMSFNAAAPGTNRVKELTGHLAPGSSRLRLPPREVPAGVNRISVSYSYNKPVVTPGRMEATWARRSRYA